MPINASIPLQVQGVDPNSFTNALAAGLKMRQLQNADERLARKDEAAIAKTNALSKFGMSDRGPEALRTLYQEAPDAGPGVEKNIREAEFNQVRTDKLTSEATEKKIGIISQLLTGVTDEPSYQQVKAQVIEIEPKAKWPERYDPAFIEITKRRAVKVGDQVRLDMQKNKEAKPDWVETGDGWVDRNTLGPPTPMGGQPVPTVAPPPGPAGAGQSPSTLTPTEDPTYRYYKNRHGLSDAGAFALSRNLTQESSHQPDARGDGGKARGLAQWHPDRWAKLEKWAVENGLDPNSKQAQMDYILEEGKGYPGYESLKGNDPEAIREFIKNFEGYGVEGARFSGLDERAAQGGGAAMPPSPVGNPVGGPPPPMSGQPMTRNQRQDAKDQRQSAKDAEAQRIAQETLKLRKDEYAAKEKARIEKGEVQRGQRLTAADASKAQQKLIRIEDAKRQIALVRANWEGRKDEKGNQVAKGVKNTMGAGPFANLYAPGWAYGAGQKFDKSVESFMASKTAILRVPGIGSQSNLDVGLDREDIPARGDQEETTEQQIKAYEDQLNHMEASYRGLLAGPAEAGGPAGPTPGAPVTASPLPSTSLPKPVAQTAQTEFDSMPSPGEYAGKRMRTREGTVYRSNGTQWVRE